ncbi:hypothetical protein BR93DRAFT_73397 [Coniochaeta sp. PMI_546]|nr:hypothetical protein BR93DRAFT_73397 [Coniochaeta sp. PMI_546]
MDPITTSLISLITCRIAPRLQTLVILSSLFWLVAMAMAMALALVYTVCGRQQPVPGGSAQARVW